MLRRVVSTETHVGFDGSSQTRRIFATNYAILQQPVATPLSANPMPLVQLDRRMAQSDDFLPNRR